MASIIRIKRSNVSGNPAVLAAGELAYSNVAAVGDYALSGDRLYIGMGSETAGNAANHIVIGGKYYTDLLSGTAGILSANSALIVDGDSKIDTLKTTNLQIGGSGYDNYIRSTDTNGNIYLEPNGNGYVSISGTNGLVIPSGTTGQRGPTVTGAIRYNSDNTAFEGYNGTAWSSLGGVTSVDGYTYIKAEPSTTDGTLHFYTKNIAGDAAFETATLDNAGLSIKSTTATTSDGTTGALQVAGGASIQGNLFVGGNLYGINDVSSDAYLAAQGVPNNGTTGYSFTGDGGLDTGMFSTSDGNLRFYSNNDIILELQGTSSASLNVGTLNLGTNYGTISTSSDNITITPNNDNNDNNLHINSALYTYNTNLFNDGGKGLTLGNADVGDSYIDIGGADGSYYDNPDDIALYAIRNGQLYLRTNNNDISLQTNGGTVKVLNNGHLQIPGTIETTSGTGDVILAASDGTERNAVFQGDGYLSLPNKGIYFRDSNNISGTTKGTFEFQTDDILIDSYYGDVRISAQDTHEWQFKANSGTPYLQLPNGAHLLDTGNNSILFGFGVQETGSSQRIAIGYQDGTQTGQSWDAIAIGSRAGTTNQGNNAIAMGNRAGYTGQHSDAIAIGSSPNSSVGGAGYSSQQQYAIAIGAQAGESNQQESAVALGYLAGNITQGQETVALGRSAGRDTQSEHAIAIGAYAGESNQSTSAIAIGETAGNISQQFSAIAIGRWAGEDTQGNKAVAIGRQAGRYDQSDYAIAIGHHAGAGVSGTSAQGTNAIAIGSHAAEYSQHANSIVIQATATADGTGINPDEAGLFIDPIRQVNSGTSYVMYDESTKEVTFNSTNIEISGSTIYSTDVGTDANVILEPLGTGYVSASNAQVKHVAEPTDDNDAATKYYVDAARSGLDVKQSVRLATTEDITLSGVKTIDTKTTVTGDRILVKDQDLAKNNGIYIANNSGAWTRATDFDNLANDLTTPLPGEVTGGAFTFVEDGDVNINTGFVLTNKGEPVLGTDALNWTLFSTSGSLIAGDGLVKSGYTLAVNVNNTTGGIEISDDALQLKSSLAGDGLSYSDGVLTVGGTADRITVSGTTVDIASTYAGQTSITTLGTISTGTWNGTAIDETHGGTNQTSYSKGDILYASATDTLSKLGAGDSGQVLQIDDAGVPFWGDIDGGEYGAP
jgi:hypothetical protein